MQATGAPLDGVTVLAVEQYGAGPFGTMMLADLGAHVIKIENPDGGDVARQVGPYFREDGDSLFFHAFNRNKDSLALDLKSARGRAVFEDLVRGADAVLDNLRGDLPGQMGLTYDRRVRGSPGPATTI
jgi:crotonobetainyl-CoA:carnitine CoA-transferase CaiB-like acyl-CoA transferase